MSDEGIIVSKMGPTATVTFDRPDVLNALTRDMLDSFRSICGDLDADSSVRVIIFTGVGRAFSSGIDLRSADFGRTRTQSKLNIRLTDEDWLYPVLASNKPTIAAVNGVAVGAGMAIAAACDIRIASEQARFSTGFSNRGLSVVDGVGWLLPRIVGVSKALELIYNADLIDAREAERIGLASYVEPPDRLMPRALELAAKIAAGPPVACQLSRAAVYNSLHLSYPDYLTYQHYYASMNRDLAPHDLVEASDAFREKRPAVFRGVLPPQ